MIEEFNLDWKAECTLTNSFIRFNSGSKANKTTYKINDIKAHQHTQTQKNTERQRENSQGTGRLYNKVLDREQRELTQTRT